MLINKIEERHVKFLSYTGEYPNLCSGILTLEIDGEQYKFGHSIYNETQGQFPRFWHSGGNVWFDDNYDEHVEDGSWVIDVDDLPEQFRKYASEIDDVFNANVAQGCCGGCI